MSPRHTKEEMKQHLSTSSPSSTDSIAAGNGKAPKHRSSTSTFISRSRPRVHSSAFMSSSRPSVQSTARAQMLWRHQRDAHKLEIEILIEKDIMRHRQDKEDRIAAQLYEETLRRQQIEKQELELQLLRHS